MTERLTGQRGNSVTMNPTDFLSRTADTETFVLTHEASRRFISRIQVERRLGYGFVPLIGAGFSAPSGAPLVKDLATYLQRCIWMALDGSRSPKTRWSPRTDQWPPFLDHGSTVSSPEVWPEKVLSQFISPEKFKSPIDEKLLIAEAHGAMAEWRSSLLFLSRLQQSTKPADLSRLSLGAPQHEIIDACLREVLKDRHPALNHRMLGVLAGALRLNLLLTTNFDDLLEQAFAEARNPLAVFEVHLGGGLPHWSAVSKVRSLIKLHGSRYSLRADYSLDAPASEQDKERFLEYLIGGARVQSAVSPSRQTGLAFQNHLLVMGVRADDRRTRDFIAHAWAHLSDRFKIFWLCYSDDDVRTIRQFSQELHGFNSRRRIGPVVLKHTHYGLLLLQLYQTIRKNLPPLGGVFPSVARLPLPPLPLRPRADPHSISFCAQLTRLLIECAKRQDPDRKLVIATAPPGVRGVTSACSKVFAELETSNVCLWIDMNDISSANNLFEELLEAAYFRLGQENWVPVFNETTHKKRGEEIKRVMQCIASRWIIFINARETPGANFEEEPVTFPNGWLDDEISTDPDDPSRCTGEFLTLIDQLCKSSQISVVLLCRSGSTQPPLMTSLERLGEKASAAQGANSFREELPRKGSRRTWANFLRNNSVTLEQNSGDQTHFSEAEVARKAIAWADQVEDKRAATDIQDKRRFLHALVLMQRPRLLATIWSDAVSVGEVDQKTASVGEADQKIDNDRQRWIGQLEERGLVRPKAGGFIWMHSHCRQYLRRLLSGRPPIPNDDAARIEAERIQRDWGTAAESPAIHTRLAKWYEKVLDTSDAPTAVFEAVYHLCRAAEGYVLAAEADMKEWAKATRRIEIAAALLRRSGFLIQTHGYARGSCRRLENIRNKLCGSLLKIAESLGVAELPLTTACRRLQLVCTEVMRAVAREVGEIEKAILRHRQFGCLIEPGGNWNTETPDKPDIEISRGVLNGLLSGDLTYGTVQARCEWARWWRWSGMLNTASRSYLRAGLDFVAAWNCTFGKVSFPDLTSGRGSPAVVPAPDWDLPKFESQALRIEALRAVEQYVELLLLQYSVEQRLRCVEPSPDDDVEKRANSDSVNLEGVEKWIQLGMRLSVHIRGKDDSPDSQDTRHANWCQSRLLTHASVCVSRRSQGHIGQDYRAMSLLGDAESILRISDTKRYRSELGMVELHRAEARLRTAEAVEVCRWQGRSLSFAEMYRQLEQLNVAGLTDKQRQSKRKDFVVRPSAMRRVRSLVNDGLRFLDRVEPILRERRRNVWWTTWFSERYLRLAAMSVWTSVFENGAPIPFLDLQAAPFKTMSVPEDLLENARRMISIDLYRWASIVDAFASCAKALQLRLVFDPEFADLDSRLTDMTRRLNEARAEWEATERRRKSPEARMVATIEMDSKVGAYVEAAERRVGLIYSDLPKSV